MPIRDGNSAVRRLTLQNRGQKGTGRQEAGQGETAMKTTNWITGALVAAMGLTAVAAQAQGTGPGDHDEHRGMMFGAFDGNGDGKLTPEEMAARAAERFAKADSDGDGMLSVEEMNAAAAERIAERNAKMIERMDQDGDGMLSLEEIRGRRDPAQIFKRLDKNSDGVLSEKEFAEAAKMMRGHHGKGPHKDHDKR
ncbi:EF-hand domain-containing protein [Puniceibacterium antarcticum]|nr:EF-hand domain-containing protein [Puniceibacterium antarcticum]